MNLWHDKSYIAPSGPEWVERGYAMYDVHLLWSSVFVTLVAKKYRFMQFELDMVFDTR